MIFRSNHETALGGGGPNAAMRFPEGGEAAFEANEGLDATIVLLAPLKLKYRNISHADLWALAANVAIQEVIFGANLVVLGANLTVLGVIVAPINCPNCHSRANLVVSLSKTPFQSKLGVVRLPKAFQGPRRSIQLK